MECWGHVWINFCRGLLNRFQFSLSLDCFLCWEDPNFDGCKLVYNLFEHTSVLFSSRFIQYICKYIKVIVDFWANIHKKKRLVLKQLCINNSYIIILGGVMCWTIYLTRNFLESMLVAWQMILANQNFCSTLFQMYGLLLQEQRASFTNRSQGKEIF